MNNIIFVSTQEFTQAAFNQVAKIVAEHGNPCLEVCCPAELQKNTLSI